MLLLLLPLIPLTLSCKPNSPRLLRVTFLDVGQGDAAVIESPEGRVLVVDAGGYPGTDERMGDDPGNRVVAPYLRSRGISTIDMIVATHPDDDHVQGLNALVGQFTIRTALINGYPGPSQAYDRLLQALQARRIPVRVARAGQRLSLDRQTTLEILHPTANPITKAESPTNANSIVFRLVYRRARILFTGDAEEEAERYLLASGSDLSADILKVGHHGSQWSTGEAFLAQVRPTAAIISTGSRNIYGHPSRKVLERLHRLGVRIFRTDTQGAITVETDGQRVRVIPFHRETRNPR